MLVKINYLINFRKTSSSGVSVKLASMTGRPTTRFHLTDPQRRLDFVISSSTHQKSWPCKVAYHIYHKFQVSFYLKIAWHMIGKENIFLLKCLKHMICWRYLMVEKWWKIHIEFISITILFHQKGIIRYCHFRKRNLVSNDILLSR